MNDATKRIPHTPTPWHAYQTLNEHAMPTTLLRRWTIGDPQFAIAGIALTGDSRIDESNADFIVEACNTYDANQARIAELEKALELSWRNDWNNLGGDVCEYTFHRLMQP